MHKLFLILSVLVLVSGTGIPQEKKEAPVPVWKVPPEEAKRENPIKPTPASIEQGKSLYSSQCQMCHGPDGNGQGDLAIELKLKLRDYRDPAALKDMTDGELFYILNKGKGQMPGQEGRLRDTQKWNLINYIRSLARKASPPKPPPS